MKVIATAVAALAPIALLGPGASPLVSGASGAPVVEVPSTIDTTGAADVTAVLNEFLAGVEDGRIVRLGRGGRYRVDGTLVIEGRSDLIVEGNGATFFAGTEGDRSRNHLSILGSARIVVRDVRIEGAHEQAGVAEEAWRTDRAFQHGIRILGSQDVELDRVEITKVFGDFVYIGPTPDGIWSERIWVHDCDFARNGRQGVAVTAGREVVIEHNAISGTRHATIDLEPNDTAGGAENVHVLDNRIGAGRLRFVAAHGNGPVNRVVIEGNVLSGRDLAIDVKAAAHLDRRRGFWVLDNRSDLAAANTPIQFERVDGVEVRGNRQKMRDRGEAAVALDDVCSAVVEDNDFGDAPAVERSAAACGDPPVEKPPAPPAIAAPDFGRYEAPTTATSTTTTPVTTAPAPTTDDAGIGGERNPTREQDDLLLPAVVGGGALVVIVTVLVTRSRKRRRDTPSDRPDSG